MKLVGILRFSLSGRGGWGDYADREYLSLESCLFNLDGRSGLLAIHQKKKTEAVVGWVDLSSTEAE